MNECGYNAQCKNTEGGYRCNCTDGFYGNGLSCSSKFHIWNWFYTFNLERDNIIATFQPYRKDEVWESIVSCESDQFIKLKFDSMDISEIAIDVLKIQLLTADLSKRFPRYRKNHKLTLQSRAISTIYVI